MCIRDRFTTLLTERMSALQVGDGADEATQVGPLVEPKAVAKVKGLVDDAVARGARVHCGGAAPDGPGYFYPPTVLSDVDPAADLMATEIFGPVAAIVAFGDADSPTDPGADDEVLALANDTPWGLVGYLFSQDVDRLERMSAALEVGMVGINTGLVSNPAAPFGGIKESGLGREGGRLGIEEFLDVKYLAVPVRR